MLVKRDDISLERLMGAFGLEPPGPRAVFMQLRDAAAGNGALATKTKELIALAVCIAGRREDGLEDRVRMAIRAGASRPEVFEVIGQAILMGGPRSVPLGQLAADVAERL